MPAGRRTRQGALALLDRWMQPWRPAGLWTAPDSDGGCSWSVNSPHASGMVRNVVDATEATGYAGQNT